MVSTPLHIRPDGIAVVTIDLRNSNPASALAALRSGLLAACARASAEGAAKPKGLVLRIIGDRDVPSIDPTAILAGASAEQLAEPTRELADLLSQLEDAPVSVAAVMEGAVIGAGFETALACGHRIMVRSSDTRIGLPALSLGLLPAAGGVGRLLRHMPLRGAIDFLAKGQAVEAAQAHERGLADELADSYEAAESSAASWLSDPARESGKDDTIAATVDPGASQAAAAVAMAALPGRRRAAIALAAVASAWATEDRSAAADTELRRAIELASHADTRAWLAKHAGSIDATGQSSAPGHDHDGEQSHPGDAAARPGHAAGRIRAAGLLEAMALVGDGLPAARVERLARSAGIEPTPLLAIDAISLAPIDAAHHASEHSGHSHGHSHEHGHGHDHGDHGHSHAHAHAGHRHEHEHDAPHHHDADAHAHDQAPAYGLDIEAWPDVPPAAVYVLEKMAHGFGRTGRASGGGFYDYPAGSAPSLWPGLEGFERSTESFDDADVVDRLLFAQVIEALSGLAAGRVADAAQLDEAARAAGFPIAAGITGFIANRGRSSFTARCAELASRFGDRFVLPAGALDPLSTDA